MARRAFCPSLFVGLIPLQAAEAHHVRDVMRASVGDPVKLFDAVGRSAAGTIATIDRSGVVVKVLAVSEPPPTLGLTVATAVPKADRADWLVEKLSELGVARWTPLKTARSVVHPAGEAKFDRWRRIAIEAAKQSLRSGVMEIGPLTEIDALPLGNAIVLSTRAGCRPLTTITPPPGLLLIGPEGGWADEELSRLSANGVREASLTSTILRIETAAVVGASVLLVPLARYAGRGLG